MKVEHKECVVYHVRERRLISDASTPFNVQGSPTYTKITNTVSTTTVFGLCRQVGDFGVSRGISTVPLAQISCNTVFSKSQNVCKDLKVEKASEGSEDE